MSARAGGLRSGRMGLLLGAAVLLGACGSGSTAGDAAAQAQVSLAQEVARAHERALGERAADPTAADTAAAERLGIAVTGGNPAFLVAAAATSDGVEVITTVGARAQVGGGLFYEQATSGVCLLTSATPGSPTGQVGERGTVSTEAVPCPGGVVPLVDSAPVEAVTTDLQRLQGPVPGARAAPCSSGSGDCVGGGG